MKIEFALLYSDHTWETEVVDVPFSEDSLLDDIQTWAENELDEGHRFGSALKVVIFDDDPKELHHGGQSVSG